MKVFAATRRRARGALQRLLPNHRGRARDGPVRVRRAAALEETWDGRLDHFDAVVLAEEVAEKAAAFDIGAVLERRGDDIQPRPRDPQRRC